MPRPAPLPVLVVDDRYPNRVLIEGEEARVQEKQYRLIRLLAESPGECVPYDTIYAELWGSAIVENNQMHFQKRKLLERIGAVRPEHKHLVKTVPKRGFMLDVAAGDVEVRKVESKAANEVAPVVHA